MRATEAPVRCDAGDPGRDRGQWHEAHGAPAGSKLPLQRRTKRRSNGKTHVGAAAADERRLAGRRTEAATRDLIPKLLKAHLTLPLSGRAVPRPRARCCTRSVLRRHFMDHGPLQRFVRHHHYRPGATDLRASIADRSSSQSVSYPRTGSDSTKSMNCRDCSRPPSSMARWA